MRSIKPNKVVAMFLRVRLALASSVMFLSGTPIAVAIFLAMAASRSMPGKSSLALP